MAEYASRHPNSYFPLYLHDLEGLLVIKKLLLDSSGPLAKGRLERDFPHCVIKVFTSYGNIGDWEISLESMPPWQIIVLHRGPPQPEDGVLRVLGTQSRASNLRRSALKR